VQQCFSAAVLEAIQDMVNRRPDDNLLSKGVIGPIVMALDRLEHTFAMNASAHCSSDCCSSACWCSGDKADCGLFPVAWYGGWRPDSAYSVVVVIVVAGHFLLLLVVVGVAPSRLSRFVVFPLRLCPAGEYLPIGFH
jgi:hypothetical protein